MDSFFHHIQDGRLNGNLELKTKRTSPVQILTKSFFWLKIFQQNCFCNIWAALMMPIPWQVKLAGAPILQVLGWQVSLSYMLGAPARLGRGHLPSLVWAGGPYQIRCEQHSSNCQIRHLLKKSAPVTGTRTRLG